jgi:hypothetical protein
MSVCFRCILILNLVILGDRQAGVSVGTNYTELQKLPSKTDRHDLDFLPAADSSE